MPKRKNNANQPELTIEGATMGGNPKSPDAKGDNKAPEPKQNGNGETPKAKPSKNGADSRETHVLAENVAMAVPAHPFKPGKIDLALHRRVDRGFLDYASYVIRDR